MQFILLVAVLFTATASARDILPKFHRILFLGDSITASGEYVDGVEAYLYAAYPDRQWQVINAGLPSETVSGLSEGGHADGQFPRPDLHERLDRVLEKTKPELIFLCYGMNDGIYLPLADDRFSRFREGIEKVRTKAAAAGAKVIHLTPPPFDPMPIAGKTSEDGNGFPFRGYDAVLTAYSDWLMSQTPQGWEVIDVHAAMVQRLAGMRANNPGFRFANDGVHPSEEGHWVIARAVIAALETERDKAISLLEKLLSSMPAATEYRKLIRERSRLLHHAWLSETGHQRPGIAPGLPLEEAQRKAAEIESRIRDFLDRHPRLSSQDQIP